jgi:hypothetical protein
MRPALFQRKRRLQPLTCVARHGWQRLEPSLTCQGGKGWSLHLRQPRLLNFQVLMRYEIILDVVGYRLLKGELGTVMSRGF